MIFDYFTFYFSNIFLLKWRKHIFIEPCTERNYWKINEKDSDLYQSEVWLDSNRVIIDLETKKFWFWWKSSEDFSIRILINQTFFEFMYPISIGIYLDTQVHIPKLKSILFR